MLWRAFYGFCWSDESFYISTCDRFYRGDSPLTGEWYRTQMSSIIMLPFYSAWMLVTGSNTGIVLYFRLLYLALSFGAAILYYRILKKDYPVYAAGGAALFILSFAHLSMATFSYYMLSFLFASVALILIYDHKNSKSRGGLFAAGVMTALSVMSMPAFAAVYILIMIAVICMIIMNKNRKELIEVSVYTAVGIAAVAAVFLIWLLPRIDIEQLFLALPQIFSDSEHTNTLGYYIRKPHRCMIEVFGIYTWISYGLIGSAVIFQKILKRHPFCELAVLVDAVLFVLMTVRSFGHTGYVSVAFFIFVIPVFFVSEKKNARLFTLFVIPAGLIALVYCFASSDFMYIIALGCAIASMAGICLLYDFAEGVRSQEDENTVTKRAAVFTVIGAAVCMLAITFVLRITNVYRDAPLPRLTEKITSGVARGLYTTKEHLKQYEDVYEVINEYCMDTEKFDVISGKAGGNVLFSKILPWGYAASGLSCGYPTTWRSTAYDEDQLEIYYEINKNSRPDVIIVLDSRYGSYDACGDVEDDHEPNLDELPDSWKDYIKDNGLDEITVKCGKVYLRTVKE